VTGTVTPSPTMRSPLEGTNVVTNASVSGRASLMLSLWWLWVPRLAEGVELIGEYQGSG